jgi:hypothetical protein
VPYYSELGIDINKLSKNTVEIDGFSVISKEMLLVLKQIAEKNRENSIKGLKDRIDIMMLLSKTGMDFKKYMRILEENRLFDMKVRLKSIIMTFNDLKYIGINPRENKLLKDKLIKSINAA